VKVVSVINYKGGVGKTTLTANLGAYLARRGKRVLLIDLDPQSSLTFSFYAPDQAGRSYPADRTLKQWFDSFARGEAQRPLSEFVSVPREVNETVVGYGGFIGLIPSSLHLVDVDMSMLITAGMHQEASDKFIYKLRSALATALAHPALGSYDFVLIDCPPNFNIVTQSAIVASDHYLVPASPDYLSTLGTGTLIASLTRFVDRFNLQLNDYSPGAQPIEPTPLGVVFTMVEYHGAMPIAAHRNYMERARRAAGDVPVFGASVRHNSAFGKENPLGVPVILRIKETERMYIELMELANEFLHRFDHSGKRVAA
jgi:chromosome partitioning protein